jgi:hypothetical protein
MNGLQSWLGHMKKDLLGAWDASKEFAYYMADQRLVLQHRAT